MNFSDLDCPLVVRIGGRVLLGNDGVISSSRILAVSRACISIAEQFSHLVIVVGAAGAHNFIDAATRTGSSEAEKDLIGISITNIVARLVMTAVRSSSKHVYSGVVRSFDELQRATCSYKIAVVGTIEGSVVSSDSTAAILAEGIQNARLLIVKNDLSYLREHGLLVEGVHSQQLALGKLMNIVLASAEFAGERRTLDFMALRIIQRSSLLVALISFVDFTESSNWSIALSRSFLITRDK